MSMSLVASSCLACSMPLWISAAIIDGEVCSWASLTAWAALSALFEPLWLHAASGNSRAMARNVLVMAGFFIGCLPVGRGIIVALNGAAESGGARLVVVALAALAHALGGDQLGIRLERIQLGGELVLRIPDLCEVVADLAGGLADLVAFGADLVFGGLALVVTRQGLFDRLARCRGRGLARGDAVIAHRHGAHVVLQQQSALGGGDRHRLSVDGEISRAADGGRRAMLRIEHDLAALDADRSILNAGVAAGDHGEVVVVIASGKQGKGEQRAGKVTGLHGRSSVSGSADRWILPWPRTSWHQLSSSGRRVGQALSSMRAWADAVGCTPSSSNNAGWSEMPAISEGSSTTCSSRASSA